MNPLNVTQANTNNGVVHPQRAVSQHAVLHLAGGAIAARRRGHHAADSRADQAIRYVAPQGTRAARTTGTDFTRAHVISGLFEGLPFTSNNQRVFTMRISIIRAFSRSKIRSSKYLGFSIRAITRNNQRVLTN